MNFFKIKKLRKYLKSNGFDFFNIIIALVSLLLAFITMNSITRVEGIEDLIKKTSENNTKLNQMVKELKKQNESQQISLEKSENELNELKFQTKALFDLLETNNNQLRLLNKREKSIDVSEFYKLQKILREIDGLEGVVTFQWYLNKSKREDIIVYFNQLISIIYQGTENIIIKQNDKIYSEWWGYSQRIKNSLYFLEGDHRTYEKVFNVKANRDYQTEEYYVGILKDLKKYSIYFIRNGVEPIRKHKQYRNLYEKYFKNARKVR